MWWGYFLIQQLLNHYYGITLITKGFYTLLIRIVNHSDPFALLCSGIAERTSEFKEGAKTINFRRVLLTKCYEALIEEPEVASPPSDASISTTENPPLHSWRRQRMLENVCFLGELFRRQLLTENIMHVCVAMMLEEEVKPQMEIIDAACRLLALV